MTRIKSLAFNNPDYQGYLHRDHRAKKDRIHPKKIARRKRQKIIEFESTDRHTAFEANIVMRKFNSDKRYQKAILGAAKKQRKYA